MGENPGEGVLERVQPGPNRWAAEGVVRRQGVEEKSGNLGTGRRKLPRSLYSSSL